MAVIGVTDSSWTGFSVLIFHYKHSKVDAQQGSGQTTLRIREFPQLEETLKHHWVLYTSCGWFQRPSSPDPGWELNGKAPGCCKHKGRHWGGSQDLNKCQNPVGDLSQSWLLAWGGASNQHTHTYKENINRELSGAVLTLEENLFILCMNFLNLMSFEL